MKTHIEALIKKAAEAQTSEEAAQYSLAAAQCAGALAQLAHMGIHLS